MQSIVKKGWSASSFTAAQRPATAVVATRGSFPDALAASSLAGAYGAPVLMTNPQVLSGETKSELTRLKIKRVFIVGGPLALSSGVEKAIKQLGIKVERVAGTKSSSTAVAIAKKLPNPSKTCIVATRANYKDALSASPYAYAKQVPIFLVEDRGKTITQETLNAIKTGGFTSILIVGGTSAVSDGVEKKLKSMKATVKRIGGRTAVDTSIELAKWQLNNGMSLNKGAIATSNNFPDALAGAALCGKNKAVLILSSKGGVSKVAKVFQPLCKQTGAKTVYVFGGTFAVSDKEYRSLFNSSLLERATALSLDGYYYYGSVYSASPSSAQALRT
ncbi:MAG: cell wall-binding repeat-containing protein [Eggerthellaceae bacterium]|nr:cell wall-binding repeat-containing protein [Eggerthellaceae bacterium]